MAIESRVRAQPKPGPILGVSTAATPIYTYKGELDIAFSTTASLCGVLGSSLYTSIFTFRTQGLNPDGQGDFLSLGDILPVPLPRGASFNQDTGILSGVPVAVVRNHPGSDGTATASPLGFTPIYDDFNDMTLWVPTPPDGYVALGMVVTNTDMNTPPATTTMVCIRKDLVASAQAGAVAWSSSDGQGNIWLYAIAPDAPPNGEAQFSPGTFVASGDGSPPAGVYCLRIETPETQPPKSPTPPAIPAQGSPPPMGGDSVTATTVLPFFAVADATFDTIVEQMLANPTYTLQRTDVYALVPGCSMWNKTGLPQTESFNVTVGYNKQNTTDFSETTGIDFGAQFGGPEDPVSFSLHLSESFTVGESISSGYTFDIGVSIQVTADSDTTVAAYWIFSTFVLLRSDGSQIGNPVTAGLDRTVVYVQYPPRPDPPEPPA